MSGQQTWHEFCDGLKALGDLVSAAPARSDMNQAEGYRYLTRLLRLALEMNLEHSSARHPSFYSLSHETAKIGGDNPDNVYLNANIDGRFDYEIYGEVGDVPYLSFGSKENRYAIDGRMISTGEVELKDLQVDAQGQLRLVVSRESQPGNWLPAAETSNMVIVRQTFDDRSSQRPARLRIRRLQPDPEADILGVEALDAQLQRTLGFVGGTANTFLGWVDRFRQEHFNQFQLGDQSFFQAAGGDPNICYIYAFWQAEEDELLRVTTQVPECDYWNFQLTNVWMESLDYRHHPVHLNNTSCDLEPDGSVRIHISHRPRPELTNNLVTTGHRDGLLMLRWIGANAHPVPTLEVLKDADL